MYSRSHYAHERDDRRQTGNPVPEQMDGCSLAVRLVTSALALSLGLSRFTVTVPVLRLKG